MIGRTELAALVIEDRAVVIERATLWVGSDGHWHIEVETRDTAMLSGPTRKQIALLTVDGEEYGGEVRIGPRRLFPFNRTIVLDGVRPLQGLNTPAVA